MSIALLAQGPPVRLRGARSCTTNEVFVQAVAGFCHLEEHGVLHRDIRTANILVSKTGQLKIIDFGFGKQVSTPGDFDKSVSLNWWCELPEEFERQKYDFATEVYFVGKLFSKILEEYWLEEFHYKTLLAAMCERDPARRTQSFALVQRAVLAGGYGEIPFTKKEVAVFRGFASMLTLSLSKVENGCKYITDADKILRALETLYSKTMLSEELPDNRLLLRCFLEGTYFFKNGALFVSGVKAFLDLFRSASREKKQIIISNLHAELDAVARYERSMFDDEIPF